MAARSRFHNQSGEWESMRGEDYNSIRYEAQYPDDDASGGVQLDHCRLYIRNIPSVLNEEGLRTAFSKYGTLTELFLSSDPEKKYGLVKYETPGEAKLAMTKLNRTEPLQLNINIAHKRKRHPDVNKNVDRDAYGSRRSQTEDVASVGSRGKTRKPMDLANGDNDVDDEIGGNEFEIAPMDPDLELELEQIKLKQLELQEEQVRCKQRLLLLKTSKRASAVNTSTNRCILPDGRIVVRNVSERNLEPRDADASFGAGAGDSLKIPALQRVASRVCVACGADADSFCARCGVTPYCSGRCQRRDWAARHQAVCHNLARLHSGADCQDKQDAEDSSISPPAPLRRPHSPAKSGKREPMRQDDTGFDRQNEKVFTPPGQMKQPQRNFNNTRDAGRNINNNMNRDNKRDNRDNKDNRRDNRDNRKPYERRPQPKQASQPVEEEEWGKSPSRPEVQEPKPTPAPQKAQTSVEPKPVSTPAEPKPATVQHKPIAEAKPVPPVSTAAKLPAAGRPPVSVTDVTPVKKIIPKNYVIETLPIGSTALLSVDNVTSSCATSQPGFVCLSVSDTVQDDYQALCETYVVDCEADSTTFKPSPGDMFSYLSPEDGGWYRARCLTAHSAALVDSSKLVELNAGDKTKRLSGKYEAMPEYCCVLAADNVKVGDNLQCTLVAKTADGYKVMLENVETGAAVAEGTLSRWRPLVQYPPPPVAAAPAAPLIPEVPRPDVTNNSQVYLVDAASLDKAFVRPALPARARQHDQLLQDVFMHAAKASPLTSPPTKGDTVIGKFTDGCYYRALCKRTNVAQNKYLIEYIDFGNTEIAKLENLYPCPPQYSLGSQPTLTSHVSLLVSCGAALTPAATEYVDRLKDGEEELMLTIPTGAKTAPSGSAVTLAVVKTNESVNRKLEEYCTPEWKKLEDVVESPKLMYDSITYIELPSGSCELEVVEFSSAKDGVLSAHPRGAQVADTLAKLTERMAEYCDSEIGKQPYLPTLEELCIAKCPPYEQWFRAVVVEHSAGDAQAQVLYIDYGNVEFVPVNLLRKMLPEFAAQPALVTHIEIEGFPRPATDAQLAAALTHMQVSDEGRGVLRAQRCKRLEPGLYLVTAPDLIAAMNA